MKLGKHYRTLMADRFFVLISVLLLLSVAWWALESAGSKPGTRTGRVQTESLTEISGIALSRQNNDVIWAHNDSGDEARVFALGTDGGLLGVFRLEGARAIDWEDIAIGPGPSKDRDYLYIADTGNNDLSRRTVTVYRVLEPLLDTIPAPKQRTLTGIEVLSMRFPADPRECETLLVDPLTEDIYLISRERSEGAREVASVFHAPGPHRSGTLRTLGAVGSFAPSAGIRGGDISRDGRMIILRSHSPQPKKGALLWKKPDPDSPLHEIFREDPIGVPVRSEPQGESIAFSPDGEFFFTVSEGVGASIYRFDVP